MKLIRDLGTRFPTEKSKGKKRYGLYACPVCSKEFEAQVQNVKNGSSTKCRECADKIGSKKRMTFVTKNCINKRIYNIYKGILYRCNDISDQDYGGKGVKVCEEWNDYFKFEKWSVENGYSDNLTIDRIDSDGDYEPSNCRWATKEVQSRNTRVIYKHNTSGYRGVHWSKTYSKFIAKIKVNGKFIYLGRYDNPKDGAKAYDMYVIDNNLEHTINGVEI